MFLNRISYIFSPPKAGDMVIAYHPFEKSLLILKRIINTKQARGKWRYWLEGINQRKSEDSRSFGWISRNLILGKAYLIR